MTKKKLIAEDQEKRLEEAVESIEEIQKKLAPFIKPRKMGSLSTEGRWQKTPTSVTVIKRDEFHNILKKIVRPLPKVDVEQK